MLAPIPKRHNRRALDLKQALFKSALDIRLLTGEPKRRAVDRAARDAGLVDPIVPMAFWNPPW